MKLGYFAFILTLLCSCAIDHQTQDIFSGSPVMPIANSGGDWDVTVPSEGGSDVPPGEGDPNSPPFHNTKFCKLDAQGNIESPDSITVSSGNVVDGHKDVFDGLGGGAVLRGRFVSFGLLY